MAGDVQRNNVLQAYVESIKSLLLDKEQPLVASNPSTVSQGIARALTLAALTQLDSKKGSIQDRVGVNVKKSLAINFLLDSGLNSKPGMIFSLSGANLSGADISGADLRGADLSGADLSMTDLRGTDLRGTDLRGADLSFANLSGADLSEAFVIGDSLRDLQPAASVGARPVLVLTGKGGLTQAEGDLPEGTLVFADLAAAVDYILKS